MSPIALTRSLVDIPSITEEEEAVGLFLEKVLSPLLEKYGGQFERMPVAPRRFNLFAHWGEPTVTFSTHIDTVPPFFSSSEDEQYVYGRGSCDAKGIAACMICAIEELLSEGRHETGLGLLLVVGEERGSAGAIEAGKHDKGSKYLINGEPTENKLALGTKGALRLEIIASGKMAHSAYPDLGESAINKLLEALQRIQTVQLPIDPVLGPSTLNIGTIRGGRAPNVIADEASAELLIRLVDDGESTREAIGDAVGNLAIVREVLCIPACHLGSVAGFETTTVAYTTDIPPLTPAWGKPYLLGPGTIHVAHTAEERVLKSELIEAVELYKKLASALLAASANERSNQS